MNHWRKTIELKIKYYSYTTNYYDSEANSHLENHSRILNFILVRLASFYKPRLTCMFDKLNIRSKSS